jgi:DNA-binding protein HU-beta
MYKTDLIQQVAKRTRLSQREVADVVTASLEAIQKSLQKGQRAQLSGFGTFYTRERPKAQARNFVTGQLIEVPAMQLPGFRAGAILRSAIRGGKSQTTAGRKVKNVSAKRS